MALAVVWQGCLSTGRHLDPGPSDQRLHCPGSSQNREGEAGAEEGGKGLGGGDGARSREVPTAQSSMARVEARQVLDTGSSRPHPAKATLQRTDHIS